MSLYDFSGQHIVILGLARQGLALARFFVRAGAAVTISDAAPAEKLGPELAALGDLPVQLALGSHPLALLDNCSLLCLSGGVPPQLPIVQAAVARGIPLSNDSLLTIQLASARGLGPIVAITGSSGKTTTTTLVGLMLAARGQTVHVGGNIGTPLIDKLDAIHPGEPIVLELSSFQLELYDGALAWGDLAALHLAVGAILNITPNHLDRHANMAAYADAKFNLLRRLPTGAAAILGADDPVTSAILSPVLGAVPGSAPGSASGSGSVAGSGSVSGTVSGCAPGSVSSTAPGAGSGAVPGAVPGSVPGSVSGSVSGSGSSSGSGSAPSSGSSSVSGAVPGSVSGSESGAVPGSMSGSVPGSVPARAAEDPVQLARLNAWNLLSATTELHQQLAARDIRLLGFSRQHTCAGGAWLASAAEGDRLMVRGQPVCTRGEVKLRGDHNISNLLAAMAISAAVGADPAAMAEVARTFTGVPHRLEIVSEAGGVTWINDSIATSPERAVAGLRSFARRGSPLILLAGGKDKNLPWEDFAAEVLDRVDFLIGFGQAGPMVVETVQERAERSGRRPPSSAITQRLDEAVELAARAAEPGAIVLLSPGGTSYDAYKDFEARGEHFRRLVQGVVRG